MLKPVCLLFTGFAIPVHAGEVAALAKRFAWPGGNNNFGTYTKAAGGTITQSAGGSGWSAYASASFHALAISASGTSPNNGSFNSGFVGGSAYWFEQITISSPTVAAGTTGRATFTLYFDGRVSTGPLPPRGSEHHASISYRWAAIADGADNVADPNVGEPYGETITVFPGAYIETTGSNFRNQPRQHSVLFRYGQPFDFTIALHSDGNVPFGTAASVQMELRCTGWNGLTGMEIPFDVHAPGGTPVTDAVVTSQSGFNYAQPGSITYPQWASLYQLDAASALADANGNGLTNQLEYALGLNPVDPASSAPLVPGTVNVGGQNFASFTFTRPRLGARAGDITYLPCRSTTPGNWSTAGVETTVTPGTNQTETVTVRSTQPIGTQQREFFRLDVAPPAP